MTSPDWSRRIGRAKAAIDHGFSRVGPALSPGAAADGALLGAAGRIVRVADAVALLCQRQHSRECGPLLRSAAGIALAMRCVASVAAEGGAADLRGLSEGWDCARLSSEAGWRERLGRTGLSEKALGSLDRDLRAVDEGAAAPGAAGIPWAHVFDAEKPAERDPEEVLRLTVRLLGLALEALETRWPGMFPGAEEIACGS